MKGPGLRATNGPVTLNVNEGIPRQTTRPSFHASPSDHSAAPILLHSLEDGLSLAILHYKINILWKNRALAKRPQGEASARW